MPFNESSYETHTSVTAQTHLRQQVQLRGVTDKLDGTGYTLVDINNNQSSYPHPRHLYNHIQFTAL